MTVQWLGGIISLAIHDLGVSTVSLAAAGAGRSSYVGKAQGV